MEGDRPREDGEVEPTTLGGSRLGVEVTEIDVWGREGNWSWEGDRVEAPHGRDGR